VDQCFLPITRVFENAGPGGGLYAIANLASAPTVVARALSMYGSVKDGGITLPVPQHQHRLARAAVLGFVRVGSERGLVSKLEFVDRPDNAGATKMEDGVEFTKARDDMNSTVPARRSEGNLSNTLIKGMSPSIRHVMSIGGDQKAASEARIVKMLTTKSGSGSVEQPAAGNPAGTLRSQVTCATKLLTNLATRYSSDEDVVLAAALVERAFGSMTNLLEDGGVLDRLTEPGEPGELTSAREAIGTTAELDRMAKFGMTDQEIAMARRTGRNLFVEGVVQARQSGESRRSFTFRRE
jgi:hypothetical protein